MAKVKTSVLFKQYNPAQNFLLPPSLSELISENHLVSVVDEVVNKMDITSLINQYKGGGTSAYHPRMLLKVLLYAYCTKIYTGRKIAKALRQDIHFMWLAGMKCPDFRTINNFRSGRAKDAIEGLFSAMLKFLMDHNYIKMENYFCDGSSFSANGNAQKMVWRKCAIKYKNLAEQKCKKLFGQIDLLNEAEDKQYGNKDLEETGIDCSVITPEVIGQQVAKLNKVMQKATVVKERREAVRIKKQLQEQQDKIIKYDEQIKTAGSRSGYNKTDKDASGMRMKNQQILPGYNLMAGSENQIIVNCSVHQNSNDASCFKAHLEQLEKYSSGLPKNIMADSIFGTQENYELLEQKHINNYLKYPAFHTEQKRHYKPEPFSNTDFVYDASNDTYTCRQGKSLKFKKEIKPEKRQSGYQSTLKIYECKDCSGCPFYEPCCTARKETNRNLKVNEKLDAYKKKAEENLRSLTGWELRKKRGVEIESCFGDIKHNMGIRRCHLRGLQKVKADFCLIAMAHNLRKIHLKALKSLHRKENKNKEAT